MGIQQTPAEMVTIKQYCLALPYWARVRLFQALKESIIDDAEAKDHRLPKILQANRGDFLLDRIGRVIGEPVDLHSRLARFVWARTMVGYQLTRDGMTSQQVADVIGKDRSTISYLNAKMQFVIDHPYAYEDIIDIWKRFQKQIEDGIQQGTDADPLQVGGELQDCGVCGLVQESR